MLGAAGRMGQLVCAAVEADDALELAGTYDVDNAGELDEVAEPADLVIDFSRPEALPHALAFCRRTGASLVSGTTGLTPDDLAALAELGEQCRVVWASNYSLGVAVLRKATALAAAALGEWDAEIVECHHNQKADAPSGTALTLLSCVDPEGTCPVVHGREGIVGVRPKREIGMHALRGGTVAGTHEVHFFGTDEEVTLTHRAASRQIFVAGAVEAAKRLVGAEVGLHTFDDLMFG